MNRRNGMTRVALGMLLLWPGLALANGMRLASQDGFATARGEAFAATADNASAIYYNPAGLTQLEGLNARGGFYGLYLDPTYTPPPPANTNTFHIDHKLAAVPQFFGSYTLSPGVSFGLGVYAPFGLGVSWPQNTGFRAVALNGSLTYLRINPAVALQLAPGLSIGAGLSANYAQLEQEQGLLRTEQPLVNFFRFKGDGWSAGYNLGLLWKPHEKLALGGTFRSATSFTLAGHTQFEQQPIIQNTELPAHADFQFPLNAVLGLSFRPTPKWNLEFDADYTDWSSFGTVTIQQGPPAPPFPVRSQVPVTLKWQPSWMYEFGVTRYLEKGWHVSAGYVYNENSVPDAFYTPLAADLDRHVFSVGVGRQGRRFSFDLAYQVGYGPARTVTGSTPPSTPARFVGQRADGTYDFFSQALLLTVGVHF